MGPVDTRIRQHFTEEELREALEQNPEQSDALLGLAHILWGQRRFRGAAGLLRLALSECSPAAVTRQRIEALMERLDGDDRGEPAISVILVADEVTPWLQKVTAALADQDLPADQFEVIIMDTTSCDGIGPLMKGITILPSMRILREDVETRSEAFNLGVFAARGELVLFLEEDAIPGPSALRLHLETHQGSWRQIAVLGAFPPTRGRQRMEGAASILRTAAHDPWTEMVPEGVHDWSYFWTCNLSIPRNLLVQAGGFDEDLNDPVLADLDLGCRLMSNGTGTLYEPDIQCTFEHRHKLLRYLRSTLGADHDHSRLLRKHGATIVHDEEPGVVTSTEDLQRLDGALEMWENRPQSMPPWNREAILLNLEGALRNVHWPNGRIELPHLVNRACRVVSDIFNEAGDVESARRAQHLRTAAAVI